MEKTSRGIGSMMLYDRYKDSGLEWLRQIPASWKVTHLKRDLKKLTDGAHTSPDLSSDDYPFLSVVNLKGEELSFDGCLFTSKSDYENLIRNGCRPKIGDVLFSKDGTIGEVTEIKKDIEFVVGSSFIIITPNPKKLNSTFLKFYLKSPFVNDLARASVKGTGLPRLSIFNFGRIPSLVPSLIEQESIAQYLDTKTQAIDKKVKLLEQKIDYYKELRKSLINDAVTKGLDKTVSFKDSGIDWIGQIPEHWEVKRLKYFGSVETSSVNKKTEEDEELVYLVNYTDVYENPMKEIWNSTKYMKVSAKPNQLISKKLRKGDVLFTPSSETIEDIGVSSVVMEDLKDTLYSYHLLRLRFKRKIDTSFKKYMFNNDFVQLYMSQSATGTTRKILGLNTVNNTPVVLPPTIEEQTQIAEYLDQKTTTIDKIVQNITDQIDRLKELRITLINDVVTGKIRVFEPVENKVEA